VGGGRGGCCVEQQEHETDCSVSVLRWTFLKNFMVQCLGRVATLVLFHTPNVKVVIFNNFNTKSCKLEESVSYEISKEMGMKLLCTVRHLFLMFAAS
jgi:hypothetical protein